jgi:hypothetical protein
MAEVRIAKAEATAISGRTYHLELVMTRDDDGEVIYVGRKWADHDPGPPLERGFASKVLAWDWLDEYRRLFKRMDDQRLGIGPDNQLTLDVVTPSGHTGSGVTT